MSGWLKAKTETVHFITESEDHQNGNRYQWQPHYLICLPGAFTHTLPLYLSDALELFSLYPPIRMQRPGFQVSPPLN